MNCSLKRFANGFENETSIGVAKEFYKFNFEALSNEKYKIERVSRRVIKIFFGFFLKKSSFNL